jgi:hypothetical protein
MPANEGVSSLQTCSWARRLRLLLLDGSRKAKPAKPASIIAHVEGSGAGIGGEGNSLIPTTCPASLMPAASSIYLSSAKVGCSRDTVLESRRSARGRIGRAPNVRFRRVRLGVE